MKKDKDGSKDQKDNYFCFCRLLDKEREIIKKNIIGLADLDF